MKKLALALVCLVSVAFFASCDPKVENPEPSIAGINEEGYITDGQVIEAETPYMFGFRAASNAETQKDLAKFVISINGTTYCDSVISGKEFVYRDEIAFYPNNDEREIIGSAEIVATVTDAAGNTKSASIKIDVNKEDTLEAFDFSWNRHGGQDGTGLDVFGLKWDKNLKDDVYAVIEPLEGAVLYEFDPSVWETTTTELELANLFSEQLPILKFNKVSAYTTHHDYDFVIGTSYEGVNYLIHITEGIVSSFKGTDITINGQYK